MADGDLTSLANVKAWLDQGQVAEPAVIPGGAEPYTVTVAKAAAWNGDGGVILTASGAALTPVTGTPGPEQYAVAAGVYTFNAAQKGLAVSIAYSTTMPADVLLARRISAASSWVLNYLDRDILSRDYVEVRDGHGGQQLFLRRYPITAVSLVKINDLVISPAPGTMQRGYYFTDNLLSLRRCQFVRGCGNVEIHYTAGFAATPPELEQAVIELVAYSFKERAHIGQQSASMQGQHISFNTKDMPDSVKSVLDHFSRKVPV